MRIRGVSALAAPILTVPLVLLSVTASAGASAATGPASVVPGPYINLTGVSAVSRSDVWAVGANFSHVYALHWNGRSWRSTAISGVARGSTLTAVSAVSPGDVWAVGNTPGGPLILHWNGVAWHRVASPVTSFLSRLAGVDGVSASDAWIVGGISTVEGNQVLILHWNGATWTQVPAVSLGVITGLSSIEAVSASNAWAAGAYVTSGITPVKTLVLHWNGTSWKQVPSPNPRRATDPMLSAISAASARDIWAVGSYSPPGSSQASLAMHWNGTSWRMVPTPNPGRTGVTSLRSVSAVSGSDAWAVGYFAPATHCCDVTRALILHWNGRSWSRVAIPNPGLPGLHDNSLDGISAVSARDIWAVGAYHRHSINVPIPFKLRWNGRAWLMS